MSQQEPRDDKDPGDAQSPSKYVSHTTSGRVKARRVPLQSNRGNSHLSDYNGR